MTLEKLRSFRRKNRFWLRIVLLVLLILLPFVLYLSLQSGMMVLSVVTASVVLLCMLFLVWLG